MFPKEILPKKTSQFVNKNHILLSSFHTPLAKYLAAKFDSLRNSFDCFPYYFL